MCSTPGWQTTGVLLLCLPPLLGCSRAARLAVGCHPGVLLFCLFDLLPLRALEPGQLAGLLAITPMTSTPVQRFGLEGTQWEQAEEVERQRPLLVRVHHYPWPVSALGLRFEVW